MPTKYFSKTIECVLISLIIRFQGIFCESFSTSTESAYVSLVYWEFYAVKSKNTNFYKLKKYSEISTFFVISTTHKPIDKFMISSKTKYNNRQVNECLNFIAVFKKKIEFS